MSLRSGPVMTMPIHIFVTEREGAASNQVPALVIKKRVNFGFSQLVDSCHCSLMGTISKCQTSLELIIPLCSCDDYVHPYSHCFRWGRYKKVSSFPRFYAKGQVRIWTLVRSQMIKIHLLNRLKVHTALWFMLVLFVWKVQEWSFCTIEHEPAFAPCLDAATHLHHVAFAYGFTEVYVFTNVRVVACGLNVAAEIKILACVW